MTGLERRLCPAALARSNGQMNRSFQFSLRALLVIALFASAVALSIVDRSTARRSYRAYDPATWFPRNPAWRVEPGAKLPQPPEPIFRNLVGVPLADEDEEPDFPAQAQPSQPVNPSTGIAADAPDTLVIYEE